MKALIVVDVQKDFVNKGSLAVPNALQIIDPINNLIKKYKKEGSIVIATQDFHPLKHISFASTHNKKPFDIIDVSYGKQQLWPDHCVQNTGGATFVEELNSQYFNKIIQKGTNLYIDSYSGFFENDGVTATKLDLYLQSENIKEILVVGLALDYCVAYTAVDAAKLGYKVSIDLNATRSINPDIKSLLEKFEKLNIDLIR